MRRSQRTLIIVVVIDRESPTSLGYRLGELTVDSARTYERLLVLCNGTEEQVESGILAAMSYFGCDFLSCIIRSGFDGQVYRLER
jgi:hypothetical protein